MYQTQCQCKTHVVFTHPAHLGYTVWDSLGDVNWWFPWGLDVALAHHQSLLYPHSPTFINSNKGGNRGTIALSWKWDPKIESVILVLFSFSRKARKDYGIMAGHGKRPLTPLLYWLGLVPTPASALAPCYTCQLHQFGPTWWGPANSWLLYALWIISRWSHVSAGRF